jgi:hypothetical protein
MITVIALALVPQVMTPPPLDPLGGTWPTWGDFNDWHEPVWGSGGALDYDNFEGEDRKMSYKVGDGWYWLDAGSFGNEDDESSNSANPPPGTYNFAWYRLQVNPKGTWITGKGYAYSGWNWIHREDGENAEAGRSDHFQWMEDGLGHVDESLNTYIQAVTIFVSNYSGGGSIGRLTFNSTITDPISCEVDATGETDAGTGIDLGVNFGWFGVSFTLGSGNETSPPHPKQSWPGPGGETTYGDQDDLEYYNCVFHSDGAIVVAANNEGILSYPTSITTRMEGFTFGQIVFHGTGCTGGGGGGSSCEPSGGDPVYF